MKPDVADINSSCQRHIERLNRPIKVLIIHGIFIMPDGSRGVGHFAPDEPDTVIARIGLDLVDRRARPGVDSRLHLHGRSYC